MPLLTTPRPLPLRHCITVPAALAGGLVLSLGATPAHAAQVAERPTVGAALKHPQRVLPAAPEPPASVVVEPGDSVSAIASRYGLDTAGVLARNGLDWSSIIHPGDVLVLTDGAPPAVEAPAPAAPPSAAAAEAAYEIVAGDTMWAIAEAHGVGVDALLSANGLTRSSIVYPGERILIPAAGAVIAVEPIAAVAPAESTAPAPAPAAPVEVGLDAEQAGNAALIISIGRSMGVPDRGIAIALATAMTESSLRNLDDGPDDSGGLFQQRPSQGWGSEADVRDPDRATRAFFGGAGDPNGGGTVGLLDLTGWESLGFGEAAQAVQISAYPDRYDEWSGAAAGWLAALG